MGVLLLPWCLCCRYLGCFRRAATPLLAPAWLPTLLCCCLYDDLPSSPLACLPAGDDLLGLAVLVLDNASVAAESHELGQCLGLWRRVQEGGGGECRVAGVGWGLQPGRMFWGCMHWGCSGGS